MKKRFFALFTAFILCMSFCFPAYAAQREYVFDDTAYIDDEEKTRLNEEAEHIYQTYHFNVAFLMVKDSSEYEEGNILDLLEAYYVKQFGEEDGIILGCDVDYWNVYCSGSAETLFSDADIDLFWDAFLSDDGTYAEGVSSYFAKVASYLGGGKESDYIFGEQNTVMCDSRLNDMADLFTDEEEKALLARLDETSLRQDFDLVVVTADDLNGKYYVDYADDYFDYNNFGLGGDRDGALLLISVEQGNRKCYISTSGRGISEFSDSDIEDMLDVIVDDHLRYGEYYEAADSFISLSDKELTPPTLTERMIIWVLISLGVALVVALIRILVMRSAMRSVRSQAAADDYLDGNINLTHSSEIFLYHTVTREKRESSSGSSSHTSSSGRSHGGGGRSF